MNPRWTTKNGRTSKRGLFVEGIWHCDCEPRLPAEKFQVKNGGKNHGRWFFTCQKPQPKRCPFFLWSDDAKVREEAALLNNSRNEPGVGNHSNADMEGGPNGWKPEESMLPEPKTPRTPMRQSKITHPMTPVSNLKLLRRTPSPPPSARSNTISPSSARNTDNEETFDWSSSADDELAEFADSLETDPTHDNNSSPRKSIKIAEGDSPSKRKHGDMLPTKRQGSPPGSDASSTWLLTPDDIPTTPTKSSGNSGVMFTPVTTPAKQPILQPQPLTHPPTSPKRPSIPDTLAEDPSTLALEALNILSPIRSSLTSSMQQGLVTLLNRHDLRTQGILKGREIARTAIQSKEKKIAELQQRIASLEAERETNWVVIQTLKSDIARSPGKRGGGVGYRRSEV